MCSITLFSLLSGQLWPNVVVFVRVSSIGQIELFDLLLGIIIIIIIIGYILLVPVV